MTALLQTVRDEVGALDPSPRALRQFGLVVGGVLAAAAGVLAWRRGVSPVAWGLGSAGGALLAAGLVAPGALRPVRRVWMAAALVMGAVMTRVILTVAWALLFVPTGLVLRAVGKDPLQRRPDPDAETYWIRKDDGGPDRDGLERYF